jgi:copper homeostasis protein CutC
MGNDIFTLIDLFVSGHNTSLELAGRIEVCLDELDPDDDYLQQAVEMLAMYRPEGGEFLFDAEAIKCRLKEVSQYLRHRAS